MRGVYGDPGAHSGRRGGDTKGGPTDGRPRSSRGAARCGPAQPSARRTAEGPFRSVGTGPSAYRAEFDRPTEPRPDVLLLAAEYDRTPLTESNRIVWLSRARRLLAASREDGYRSRRMRVLGLRGRLSLVEHVAAVDGASLRRERNEHVQLVRGYVAPCDPTTGASSVCGRDPSRYPPVPRCRLTWSTLQLLEAFVEAEEP